MVSILTGDIVNSSKLSQEKLSDIIKRLGQLLDVQRKSYPYMKYEFFRGDSV